MTDKDWKQLLRDKMDGHELPLPDGLWQQIEADLPGAVPQRRRMWASMRRYVAAAAAVILLIVGAGLLWQPHTQQPSQDRQTALVPTSSIMPPSTTESQSPFSTAADSPITTKTDTRSPITTKTDTGSPITTKTDTESPIAIRQDSKQAAVSSPGTHQEKASSEHTFTPKKEAEIPTATPDKTSEMPSHKEEEQLLRALDDNQGHHQRRIGELGLFASNTLPSLNGGTVQGSASGIMSMSDAYGLTSTYGGTFQNSVITKKMKEQQHANANEESHHHRPLSIGLSYRHPIGQRLWLHTGLVYTRLQSDFESRQLIGTVQRDQTLHYIGIPVSLAFNLWQQGRFAVYVNGGVQADLNVKATERANGQDRHMDKDRLQMSAHLGLGGQFLLTSHLGIYVEPSLRYYFDNGSSIDNYFKEHPWKGALQIGLRLTP